MARRDKIDCQVNERECKLLFTLFDDFGATRELGGAEAAIIFPD